MSQNTDKHTPYQCCPKCNGKGYFQDYNIFTTNLTSNCDVCNGAKVIPMAICSAPELSERIKQLEQEHGELLEMLKWVENYMPPSMYEPIKSLIQKIESK